jgi:hypothetical protein
MAFVGEDQLIGAEMCSNKGLEFFTILLVPLKSRP